VLVEVEVMNLMRRTKEETAVGLAMPQARTPLRLGRFMSSSSVRQVVVQHPLM
jgi:hypothetical protein